MKTREDLTTQIFGQLLVLEFSHKEKLRRASKSFWRCLCSCGNLRIVNASNLKNGHTKSCGCLRSEMLAERNFIHGHSNKRSWTTWYNMIARCHKEDHPSFKWYGARGITVCLHWHTYENFFEDMGEPAPYQEIDRIDNNLGYFPGNCRWVTREAQMQNKRQRSINPKEV
jgi:hypothetical protein